MSYFKDALVEMSDDVPPPQLVREISVANDVWAPMVWVISPVLAMLVLMVYVVVTVLIELFRIVTWPLARNATFFNIRESITAYAYEGSKRLMGRFE